MNDPSSTDFDPNQPGTREAGIFGLPYTLDEARCVVVPVPWEATVSYGCGTAKGPEAIKVASCQVDLYDADLPDAWRLGVVMAPHSKELLSLNCRLRPQAQQCLDLIADGHRPAKNPRLRRLTEAVNRGCERMVQKVREETGRYLNQGKMVALLGGDHSTPLGFLQALAERYPRFGILQVDAHADLREAYEGFTWSHASIMYNALQLDPVTRLVQVGIRDYCEEEVAVMEGQRRRIRTFFDREMKRAHYAGETIARQHARIVKELPRDVYISFDIDGLDPALCPHTGTPVPGGLAFEEALHLIYTVVASGRRIIGLDLNEVSPGADEWDANVGARLLFRMINLMARSQGRVNGKREKR